MNKLAQIAVGTLFAVSCGYVAHIATMEVPKKTQPVKPVVVETQIEKPIEKPVKKQKEFRYSAEVPLSPELQVFAKAQADANGVPYVLVLAVMEQESRFDIHADGGDSFGLMQINEVHGARDIIEEPHENIKIGTWLLGYLWREYRDWNKALVAYNCGEGGAYQQYFRHGSISSPYSREVMLRSERFAELLGEPSVLRPKGR